MGEKRTRESKSSAKRPKDRGREGGVEGSEDRVEPIFRLIAVMFLPDV